MWITCDGRESRVRPGKSCGEQNLCQPWSSSQIFGVKTSHLKAYDRADYCGTALDDVAIPFLFEDCVRLIKIERRQRRRG
jgi:hypothetical protein